MVVATAANVSRRSESVRLIERIVAAAPLRSPTSAGEKKAQELMCEEFRARGLAVEWHSFRFNVNLYANLALHFGVGTLGTLLSPLAPLAGLSLHLLCAVSYWADSTRRFYLLRRLLGYRDSQNLLATLPARGETRRRLVIAAHADSAFTGMMFWPRICGLVAKTTLPGLFGRTLALTTALMLPLAGLDLLRFFAPLPWWVRLVEALLTLPAVSTLLLALDVVFRNQPVPGANDDLSGVAALPALHDRLKADLPDDLELVLAVTGCEEASMGGSDALARAMRKRWSPANTVFLALDGLTNGPLRFMEAEGEVVSKPVPGWLLETLRRVAQESPDLGPIRGFRPPVGGTDAAVFLLRGYPATALVCVDPALGTPRHYHQPSDRPENLDPEQLERSISYAERVARALAAMSWPAAKA